MKKTFSCTCVENVDDNATPQFAVLNKGKYLVELWGASGGCDTINRSGKGAYVWFHLYVSTKTNYTIYVGGHASYSAVEQVKGGCNGGGSSFQGSNVQDAKIGGGGGGSTSFGLSLLDSDRIAVAGGGGGCGRVGNGGHAGGTTGGNGTSIGDDDPGWCGSGGTQISGGKGGSYYDGFTTHLGKDGALKQGGDGNGQGYNAGGGGGGFYGGGGSYESGGGGGSSYLNPVLYGKIISGSESFKSPEGILETGHYGDGFVQITPIYYTCQAQIYIQIKFLISFIYLGFS